MRHIRRVHDLLSDKYGKRMMMWGDIILQHPDKLDQIPKDTVMLTWGYDARANFEDQIVPFAKSGYEFFVCPGVSNWSRILPDFGVATTNIRNFVRDGAKHGALGMLNTDVGGRRRGAARLPAGTAIAWGAECAWNASTTDARGFQPPHRRRAVRREGRPFRPGDRAAGPDAPACRHGRHEQQPVLAGRLSARGATPAAVGASAERAAGARPAGHRAPRSLQARGDAQRASCSTRSCSARGGWSGSASGCSTAWSTARLYAEAQKVGGKDALPLLAKAEALVRANRDAHQALGEEFKRIWLSESKPYALDWTMKRYADHGRAVRCAAGETRRRRAENAAAGKGVCRSEIVHSISRSRP